MDDLMFMTTLIIFVIISIVEVVHLLITWQLFCRVKVLEHWYRRFDEVLDPEGTGDVYIKNHNFREKQNGS